ncbi:General transcription and DNA repair factor IIH helicase subunit xpb1 [Ancistrocladus abbreviatus]
MMLSVGQREGRARSGIVWLPCGARKSLVGVSAACHIRKSCLCLVTKAVSVDQWAFQFKLWSTTKDERICCFTSDCKERFHGNAGVVVTTYNMAAFGGKRSEESEKIIGEIRNREWDCFLWTRVCNEAKKHMICGTTSHVERTQILQAFKMKPDVNTIFLSKVW